jgi:hypothetical protein
MKAQLRGAAARAAFSPKKRTHAPNVRATSARERHLAKM